MYIDDKYGHVAPVLNEGGVLYIFDDHSKDTIYDHFIRYHKKLSDKLRLYYTNEHLVKLYNDNLHLTNSDGFVRNNYSYVFRNFDEYANKHQNDNVNPLIPSIQHITDNSCYKIPFFILFTILAAIVVVIVCAYIGIYQNGSFCGLSYTCPCNAYNDEKHSNYRVRCPNKADMIYEQNKANNYDNYNDNSYNNSYNDNSINDIY